MMPLAALLTKISKRSVLLAILSAVSFTACQSVRSHCNQTTFLAVSSPISSFTALIAPSTTSLDMDKMKSLLIPFDRKV